MVNVRLESIDLVSTLFCVVKYRPKDVFGKSRSTALETALLI